MQKTIILLGVMVMIRRGVQQAGHPLTLLPVNHNRFLKLLIQQLLVYN